MEFSRQPCPARIVEDCGCGFVAGSLGGTIFHYVKGFRNSPAGFGRGLYSGLDAVKIRAPGVAGSFALWGATFSTLECALVHLRQREDSWNPILSGAVTGSVFAARRGLLSMANGAVSGCLVLAMIEGAGAAVSTIYASVGQSKPVPKRPEWEVEGPSARGVGEEMSTEQFDCVLPQYKNRNPSAMDNVKSSQSLVDLVKISDVF
ncbi:hypothetical protein KR018_012349 [Drosophila ironensis]|nr:hypothetical protein KR018_012349 [Drosophila ironensis]